MSYSLNEVEAMAKRAARGAGLDWGVAEEAAKATRWLCGQGQDGCLLLAAVLARHHAQPQHLQAPQSLDGDWSVTSGVLCPIKTGASLSDCAARVADLGLVMCQLYSPMVLLPFVAAVARSTDRCLLMAWPKIQAVTDGRNVQIQTSKQPTQTPDVADRVTISKAEPPHTWAAQTSRAHPSDQTLQTLMRLAALTYAPATDSSRRLGAGAEQSDND